MNVSNHQYLVPKCFAEVEEKNKIKRSRMANYLFRLLQVMPLEICETIAYHIFQSEAYFIFRRVDICYQDTYYMFAGTQSAFKKSMLYLKKEVDEIKATSRAIEDENLDTPVDTFCGGQHLYGPMCPDKQGNYCSCQWFHITFQNKKEWLQSWTNIDINGDLWSQFHHHEIRDISNLVI